MSVATAHRVSRFEIPRQRTGWLLPLGIALGLHAAFLLAGYFSRHDTLLDLIAQGEVQAVAPSDPQPAVEQEVELVDLTPPPEANPDFVVPQETKPLPDDTPEPDETENPVPPPPVPPPPAAVPLPPAPEPVAPATAVAASPVEAPAAAAPVPAPVASPSEPGFAPSDVVIGNRGFPKPPYPYEAKLRHCQGTVLVALNIVDGVIIDAAVEKSSGYAVLDQSAVSWIRRKWRFPAEVTRNLTQPVAFQLSEGA